MGEVTGTVNVTVVEASGTCRVVLLPQPAHVAVETARAAKVRWVDLLMKLAIRRVVHTQQYNRPAAAEEPNPLQNASSGRLGVFHPTTAAWLGADGRWSRDEFAWS
jgi:hypothetical protein